MACYRNNCRSRIRQTQVRVYNENNFIPSAIEVFNPTTQNLVANQDISFLQTNYNTGVSFSSRLDNLGVDIVASGVYKISFTGTAIAEETLVSSFAITLNGEPLPQSEISQAVSESGPESIFTTIIFKVISPSASIGVINTSDESFGLLNAKLDIVRIGNFWKTWQSTKKIKFAIFFKNL